MGIDELEPGIGDYDWEEAFRQNPDDIDDTFCQDSDCTHPSCQSELDPESDAFRANAAALIVKTELWLAARANGEED